MDEFALLDREIESYKPRLQRHEKLRSLILSWYPDVPGDEESIVPGMNCEILMSARDKIRAITPEGKEKLFKLWGPQKFIAKANVMLKSLPDPEDPKGLYTTQAPTGPRHLYPGVRSKAVSISAA